MNRLASFRGFVRRWVEYALPIHAQHARSSDSIHDQLDRLLIMQSRASTRAMLQNSVPPDDIHSLEYRVYSQFGDDGIIAFLASFVPSEFRTFVEFGVEDYVESNTRLLMVRDNWSGFVIDGSCEQIARVRGHRDFWKYDLRAAAQFITRENINDVFRNHGINGRLGLLSIDIDGNDYWVWEAISEVAPLIVVCEYNGVFGEEHAITVPYDPAFVRSEKHPSLLYAGASLTALVELASRRGLRFIGCNSAGNNAYFLHPDLPVPLPTLTVKQGFVASKFREARDDEGNHLYQTAARARQLIEHLPVYDVREQCERPFQELLRARSQCTEQGRA